MLSAYNLNLMRMQSLLEFWCWQQGQRCKRQTAGQGNSSRNLTVTGDEIWMGPFYSSSGLVGKDACFTEDKSLANDEIYTEFAHMQDVIIDLVGVGDGRSPSQCAVH